jgi:lipoyl-dependent peroxiredoxin
MSDKVLFSAKTHTTSGHDGYGKSADGKVDIKLPEPHPAAEDLFGVARSACYMGALGVAAAQKKIKLPADPQDLMTAAHGVCPYSKAVHGNIEVTTNLV